MSNLHCAVINIIITSYATLLYGLISSKTTEHCLPAREKPRGVDMKIYDYAKAAAASMLVLMALSGSAARAQQSTDVGKQGAARPPQVLQRFAKDRKSTRLNSSP